MATNQPEQSSNRSEITQLLIKVVGALGGGAVIFYTLGFIVVQTYVYKNELGGMFWFTNEFYGDAGAKLLLAMVRASLLAFYVFLPILFLLLFLIPREKNLKRSPSGELLLSQKQWIKIFSLLCVLVLIYYFVLSFGELKKLSVPSKAIATLFGNPTNHSSPRVQQSLAFFTLVTPMLVALGVFLYRFRGCFKSDSKSRACYQIALVISLVLLIIVPIAYGLHLYDWKIVPIREPHIIEKLMHKDKEETRSSELWLLGKFGDQYLFFKKVQAKGRTSEEGVIEVLDADQVKYLNFDLLRVQSAEYFSDHIQWVHVSVVKLNSAEQILQKSLE